MTPLKLAKILELFPIPNSKEGFELEQFLGVIASLKKNGNLNDPNKRERKIRSSKKKSSSTKKLSKDKGKERNRDKDRLEKEKMEMEREK
jgi:hypothetical protein